MFVRSSHDVQKRCNSSICQSGRGSCAWDEELSFQGARVCLYCTVQWLDTEPLYKKSVLVTYPLYATHAYNVAQWQRIAVEVDRESSSTQVLEDCKQGRPLIRTDAQSIVLRIFILMFRKVPARKPSFFVDDEGPFESSSIWIQDAFLCERLHWSQQPLSLEVVQIQPHLL